MPRLFGVAIMDSVLVMVERSEGSNQGDLNKSLGSLLVPLVDSWVAIIDEAVEAN